MKIQRTRRSATPRSPRRRAGSLVRVIIVLRRIAVVVGIAVVVVEEAGAPLLAVVPRHDGDLLPPGAGPEARDAGDQDPPRPGHHVLPVVAVSPPPPPPL